MYRLITNEYDFVIVFKNKFKNKHFFQQGIR